MITMNWPLSVLPFKILEFYFGYFVKEQYLITRMKIIGRSGELVFTRLYSGLTSYSVVMFTVPFWWCARQVLFLLYYFSGTIKATDFSNTTIDQFVEMYNNLESKYNKQHFVLMWRLGVWWYWYISRGISW